MFTGIIEAVGTVYEQQDQMLIIGASFCKTVKSGQSIAVNGVCLTVVDRNRQNFQIQVLEETKRLSNLGALKSGDLVNLERAMKIGDRLDGHIVQGHVEGVGTISSLKKEMINPISEIRNSRQIQNSKFKIPNSSHTWLIKVQVHRSLLRYMIWKGIVILDGIALTITRIDEGKAEIEVAITAFTWENTNLRAKKMGDQVNIETDVIAKYMEKLI